MAYHTDSTDPQSKVNDGVDPQSLQNPVVGCKDGQLHHACNRDAQPHQHLTSTCTTYTIVMYRPMFITKEVLGQQLKQCITLPRAPQCV